MKEELIKILPDLKLAVEKGVQYAGDLFSRAVTYYKVVNLAGSVICFIGLVMYGIYIYKTYKWVKIKDEDNTWEDKLPQLFIGGIISFILLIGLMYYLDSFLQLYFIPEIYILQLLTR